MERTVTDRTISKVLIICDREYEERSNRGEYGAGDEARIISAAIYGRASQKKFVPLVREFDGTRPCLPAYLAERMFLDCSTQSRFESLYQRLVDLIYGIDVPIPPLGPRHRSPAPGAHRED